MELKILLVVIEWFSLWTTEESRRPPPAHLGKYAICVTAFTAVPLHDGGAVFSFVQRAR